MALQKEFSCKILDQDGSTFIIGLAPKLLKSPPSFRSRMNAGLGELVLDLNLPFDDFDEGNSIDFMNIVDVYAVDEDHPRGRRIYRGFISRYEPYIEGEEGVRVTLLGLGSLLPRTFYKNGGSFTVAHATQDPTIIFKAIIDHFGTVYGGSLITYDGSSIPATVGQNVSISFVDQKHFDAAKKAVELAGTGWWWSIDADGKANMKAKPSTATHTFTLGKDIDSLSCTKDSEKIVNDVYVRRNGGTETNYIDATSQSRFGTGSPATGKISKIISDSALTDVGAANQRGNKELSDGKDEKIRGTITVNTNADLEAIKVGDTIKVANIRSSNNFFSDNLQIVGLTYNADSVTIELEESSTDLGLALDDFVNS